METAREGGATEAIKTQQEDPPALPVIETGESPESRKQKKSSRRGKKEKHTPEKRSRRLKEETNSEDSDSESDSAVSDDTSDSSSEDERERRRRKKREAAKKKEKEKKALKAKAKAKAKRKKKSKKYDSSSEESEAESSDSDSDSEPRDKKRRKKKSRKTKKSKKEDSSSSESSSSSEDEEVDTPDSTAPPTVVATPAADDLETKMAELQKQIAEIQMQKVLQGTIPPPPPPLPLKKEGKAKKTGKTPLEFKRVDQVWDSKIRDYKYTESVEEHEDEFDCVFTVRRRFHWDNKFDRTWVDIKSKLLQEALKDVLKGVKAVSLEQDTPSIDPKLLFIYHEELQTHYRKTLKAQLAKEKKKKKKTALTGQIAHCKLLSRYISEDFTETRKKLHPMLKKGNITWDLVWALFKPNSIAFTHTYANIDDPRCFKVDQCLEQSDFMGEKWYGIEGQYLEYDGKNFGLGDFYIQIDHFQGPRKITSLAAYPLEYHKDPEGVKKTMVERGKTFVALQGMNYRFLKGLGYFKYKRSVLKMSINGRVMIDPAIFRRINPNYPIAAIMRKEAGVECGEDSDEDEDSDCEDCESEAEEKTCIRVIRDREGNVHVVRAPIPDDDDVYKENLEAIDADEGGVHTFTEEELLIASPVVLGFAFSEKKWLEFSLSGITDIEWNAEAFNSLVLEPRIKQTLKSLVSSHRFNAAKTIDDVIQGKGKGLNIVLHGPPGVGKTLTAESIADYLKAPLYVVSAGELGTDSRRLEAELIKIMDITHSWGAILLIDEADVFLEQRATHDVTRNGLVSIFLRQLEYYQGILFLTTNRVQTFDEAFQSRIHQGIRYENLNLKARREIWMMKIESVRKLEEKNGKKIEEFKEKDYKELSRRELNGRQIKNVVTSAQNIAMSEEEVFSMEHIKRILEGQEDFEADMRGGPGAKEALNHYT
ncbi:hypothetical protein P154DRAFT_519212 [Amniculicola lignicola CBS 123094]|uniref:AAA+ ATPase domain-containing protein n=1 Tax=Amniculicola lignicola CBS 123094 TaxID=1392246 RepID=A0A6A5WVJ1_9PLEO|nr:hypothetical protein P154DRAFT_519212 [Amniculicola lignicola CBS 123094]